MYAGLIALDYGIASGEAWRYDCPNGHTTFIDFTAEVDGAEADKHG